MSTTVDERVVSMQFDNAQFERNASQSMSTLDKLKKALKFEKTAESLDTLSEATKRLDFSPMVDGLDTVAEKFSAIEVIAVTTLVNVTNSVVNTGKQLAKSLSVDQVASGWDKYNKKIQSVQTIINSTGMSMEEVNDVLNQLMWFSDETSYSFTDMTQALAQMTSSGGKVEKLIPLITGVANATAFAGKGAAEFSRAMYNLNQSYGAGYLNYTDWRSLELAGVDSKALKQVIIDTGVAMGKIRKGKVTVSNFSQTLKSKWADVSVMEAAFGKFSELSQAAYELVQNGEVKLIDGTVFKADVKTASDAIDLLADKFDSIASTAFEAAQEYKSFSDAISATKDAVSSGWMRTFEIIFGNLEESKELWTDVGNALWEVFAKGAKARNEMLQGWKDLGGRNSLIQSFWNVWESVGKIITPIKESFRDIFPSVTAEQLADITSKLKDFTEKLKISDDTAKKFKRTFKGLFSILDIFKKTISAVIKPIGQLIGSEGLKNFVNLFLDAAASAGDFFTALDENFDTTNISESFSKIVGIVSDVMNNATEKVKGFGNIISKIGSVTSKVVGEIWETMKTVFGWISENITATDIFAGLAGGGIFKIAIKLARLVSNIKETLEDGGLIGLIFGGKKGDKESSKGVADTFKEILGSVNETLQSFTSGIKITSVVAIAVAIGILSSALRKISEINVAGLIKSLSAVGVLFVMLTKTFSTMNKKLVDGRGKGLIGASFSLILIATAINTLAKAIEKIGNLQLSAVAKGIVGVGAGLFILVKGIKAIDKIKIPFRTSISIIALAKACSILGDALKKFGEMTWGAIARGLSAMGVALAELVAVTKYLDKKFGLLNAISIDIIVLGLSKLADALAKFGAMSWEQITRGLVAMGVALLEVSKFSSAITKLGKWSALLGSITIDIIILGLNKLANALAKFGEMSWEQIGRGLFAMGLALLEVSGFSSTITKLARWSSLLGSVTIDIIILGLNKLADALTKFGEMSWEQITRGLVAMGLALLEVSKFSSVITKLKKWSALLGNVTIDIIILGLNKLADALTKFGEMSWEQIARGLVAMGFALGELGLSIGLIGKLARWSGLLGGIIIDTVTLGLNKLADALVKLGSMSWGEVGRGLVAMGLALTELGVVSGALGRLTKFAGLLGSASLWVSIQGINDLADAFKKFGSMSWDEIGRGFSSMVAALAGIALGGLLNTLSILGSLSINLMAKPLGDLADSMKKWEDVKIPEGLGLKLGFLAAGIIPFTADIVAAASIALVAKPLGDLADSIKKWKDVNVPDGLSGDLLSLADGVFAFTLDTLGAATIEIVAKPLGDMADSMKKWEDVSIPDKIGTGLKSIAEGIGAFSFVFVGGWVLNDIIQPLGELPASLKEWSNITFPDKIKEKLTDIADGVKEFSFGFLGGYSIGTIIDPLSRLPDAFSKWNDINFSNKIQTQLADLAKGVKEFSGMFGADSNFATVSGAMVKLATALSVWGTIAISDTIATDLTNISKGVKSFDDIGDISFIVQNTRSLVNSMMSLSGVNFNMISYGLSSLNAAITAFDSTKISQLGKSIIDGIVNGLTDGATKVDSAISTLISSCEVALKDVSFYDMGTSLVDGFANGITDQTFKAEASAKAMARAAYLAAKRELAINSPSKKFKRLAYSIPEGTAVGIDSKVDIVKSSAVNMAKAAIDSTKGTISKLGSILSNNNINAKPAISPVIDATNLDPKSMRLGAKINASVGRPVESIYQAVFNAQRDIKASNEAVMSAVENIRADINDMHVTGDKEIALYVDSKKLATSLAKPMNRQLNILSKRGAY